LWVNNMELRPLSLRLPRGTAVRNTHRRGAPGGGQEASEGNPSSFAVCRGCPGRGLAARGPQPWLAGAAAQARATIQGTAGASEEADPEGAGQKETRASDNPRISRGVFLFRGAQTALCGPVRGCRRL